MGMQGSLSATTRFVSKADEWVLGESAGLRQRQQSSSDRIRAREENSSRAVREKLVEATFMRGTAIYEPFARILAYILALALRLAVDVELGRVTDYDLMYANMR